MHRPTAIPAPAPARTAQGVGPAPGVRRARGHGAGVEPLAWRVVRDPPRSGARNMAIDHALAETLEPGRGVLRLYGWVQPTVSFGRNEAAVGRYSLRVAGTSGIDCVRRPTGGRAVLHSAELTYAVVTPVRALGGARLAYRLINEALAGALRSLGADVALAGPAAAVSPDAGPCFRAPAEGEVVADGRKLVGSAQARIGGALLQHGSILLAGDQSALGALFGEEAVDEPPATLLRLVGNVAEGIVAEAVETSMAEVLGGRWSAGTYEAPETAAADRLEHERYGEDSWTWRR